MAYRLASSFSAAPPHGTIAEKVTALTGLVTELATAIDANFTVVDYYDDTVLSKAANDRAQRLAIMGDPERYIEVMEAEPLSAGDFDGRPSHRFTVDIYYGVGTATRSAAAAAFRGLLYSVTADAEGIYYAVRRQGALIVASGHEMDMQAGDDLQSKFVTWNKSNDDYFWNARFTVVLS